MAWNEPGGNSGGKRNPWGGGNKPEQGPPDLDEVLRNLQRRLAGLFGGGGGGNRAAGGAGPGRSFGIGTIVVVLLAIWVFSGLYTVDAAERGIIMRFGKYVETTTPGLRWHWPWPIEAKQIVNIQSIESFSEQTRMLTSDENLVDVEFVLEYRITDLRAYILNVESAADVLRDVARAALREAVAQHTIDEVLGQGRIAIHSETELRIQ